MITSQQLRQMRTQMPDDALLGSLSRKDSEFAAFASKVQAKDPEIPAKYIINKYYLGNADGKTQDVYRSPEKVKDSEQMAQESFTALENDEQRNPSLRSFVQGAKGVADRLKGAMSLGAKFGPAGTALGLAAGDMKMDPRRMGLAFGDAPQEQQRAELERTEGVEGIDTGNLMGTVQDFPSDVADIMPEIIEGGTMAIGSIAGGIMGAPGGKAGMYGGSIAGAGIGGSLGRIANQSVANLLGVSKDEPVPEMKEAAMAGLEAAATEAIFLGSLGALKFVGKTPAFQVVKEQLFERLPARIDNSLLKRLSVKDFRFGIDPGEIVAKEGIVAPTKGGFLKRIMKRKNLVGQQMDDLIKQADGLVDDLDDVPLSQMDAKGVADAKAGQEILDAGGTIDDAAKASGKPEGIIPRLEKILADHEQRALDSGDEPLFKAIQMMKDRWLGTHGKAMKGGETVLWVSETEKIVKGAKPVMKTTGERTIQSNAELWEMKKRLGKAIKWSGMPFDDAKNQVLVDMFAATKDELITRVPGMKQQFQRYAGLLAAQKAMEREIAVGSRNALFGLFNRMTGIAAMAATILSGGTMGAATIATGLAVGTEKIASSTLSKSAIAAAIARAPQLAKLVEPLAPLERMVLLQYVQRLLEGEDPEEVMQDAAGSPEGQPYRQADNGGEKIDEYDSNTALSVSQ